MKRLLLITFVVILGCAVAYALEQPLYQYYGQTTTSKTVVAGADALILESSGDYLLLESSGDNLLLE